MMAPRAVVRAVSKRAPKATHRVLSSFLTNRSGRRTIGMDLSLEEEGAQVTAATSFDDNFPPKNILDGDNSTKWVTTGNFPQEVIVQLATTASISRVKTWSCNVKEVLVEVCSGPTPNKWEKLYETNIPESDGNMQVESENVRPGDASFIKFKILSGWNDFVSLHRVSVEGSTARR